MRLPRPQTQLDLAAQLAEFDVWITPSLGEVRDTDRFRQELAKVVEVIESLSAATKEFRSIKDCSAEAITGALLNLIAKKTQKEAETILFGAASLLFLGTGKSDNNVKCQLPLHLRDAARWTNFPSVQLRQGQVTLGSVTIPRVLAAEDYLKLVGKLHGHLIEQRRLLLEFVRFVLSDESYVAQLWSIGHSYCQLKTFKREKDLLTPLVIFQVRGSVSATGGHAPERLLRERFDEWGLLLGIDYNTADVVVDMEKSKSGRVKTRAFDFVLPFKTAGWDSVVYVQSQFYAGDSGSVSHKNVDQTRSSRLKVREQHPKALFVEYVDGAGYFSSLNGDLKTLLAMNDTHSFVQVRSAPIRLRRVLQEIGFCTPLEIEHAIARTDGKRKSVARLLEGEGYVKKEIERSIKCAVDSHMILRAGDTLSIADQRRTVARRYLLLDTVAAGGMQISSVMTTAGHILVPGFGPMFGMKTTAMLEKALKIAPGFRKDLKDSTILIEDIQWLEEKRFVMSS